MNEETLFDLVRQTPLAERAAILDRECAGNPELRQRVERLLAAHDTQETFLVSPAIKGSDDYGFSLDGDGSPAANKAQDLDLAGTMLAGKYQLLLKLGEGGMGAVWLAQQTEPVKRKVAIKLIKPGMDSEQVLKRFETERQALAMMDHPNIAKVFDGGMTPEGRPFFVMELVKGVPITEYCDENKLTPRQRMELFIPVCQAIQHAHQKGVIHRDIKPSNVLIALYDEKPVPKVIDFGLAKAAGQALTDHTLSNALGAVVGTPQYMSPEQATLNNLDIDTRSDVYSLGVLLYELLTGSPPFSKKELEKKGLLEILRSVREDEPPKPSTKLSDSEALPSISANRSTEPKKLASLLRSDLDWILLKTLEKDRVRRYETASGFAADLMRYLSGETVAAHPPSRGYRLKKFVRKNRGPAIAAGLVAATFLVGIVGTTVGLIEAKRGRDDAVEAQGKEASQREIAEANEKKAKENEKQARISKEEALREKRNALAVAASSTLDQGQQICENGDVVRGLHLMVTALQPAIDSGNASVEDAVRWNIAAWLPHSYRMRGYQSSGRAGYLATCISPDGKIIVAGTWSGELHFYDANSIQPIRRPEKIPTKVLKLAWQPHGNNLAILGRDGNLRIWNTTTGFSSARIIRVSNEMNEVPLGGLSFSSDGTKLLVGAGGNTAYLYDVVTGDRIGPGFQHGSSHSDAVAISPDGTKVVVGTPNWSVRVYELATGKPLTNVIRTYGSNFCAGISPDGTKFFTGHHMDASLQVWDINTGAPVGQRISPGGSPLSASFSPDGKRILIGGWIRFVQEWDYQTGKSAGSPIPTFANAVAYSPDGKSIIVASDGLGVWDIPTRGVKWTSDRLPGSIHGYVMRSDSKVLALTMSSAFSRDSDAHQSRFLRLYEAATGRLFEPNLPVQKYDRFSPVVMLTPDGKTAYVAEGEGLTIFDLVLNVETGRIFPPKLDVHPRKHFDAHWSYAMSSDGKFIAYATEHLQVYDTETKEWSMRRLPDDYRHHTIRFVPNSHVVVLFSGGKCYLTDLEIKADKVNSIINTGLQDSFGGASVRPDGRAIMLANSAGNIVEYDVKLMQKTGFTLGNLRVADCDYSSDCRVFYTNDHAGVTAWHLATGKKLGPYLTGVDGYLRGVCPDGSMLIICTDDRRLQGIAATKIVQGSPAEVLALVVERTGLGRSEGNHFILRPPKQFADVTKVLPPLPVADFREIHKASMEDLENWFKTLPKNFRPTILNPQEGSKGKRFDAIAIDDGTATPFEPHLALSNKKTEPLTLDQDFEMMEKKGWSRILQPSYFDNSGYRRHHIWAKAAGYSTAWRVEKEYDPIIAKLKETRKMPVAVVQYDDALALTTAPDDGHKWECFKDLSAEQVKAKILECKNRKWRPSIVHRHRTAADKYLLVLIDNPHDEGWEYIAGLSPEDYESKMLENRRRERFPAYVQSWLVGDAPSYSVIWLGGLRRETKCELFSQ